MNYCNNCMRQIEGKSKCEFCGYSGGDEIPAHHLLPGTVLLGRYVVGNALGEGGFGITYIGRDIKLDMRIAIKEYFPYGYATRFNSASENVTETKAGKNGIFDKGRQNFLKEARILGRFSGDKSIVDVRDFFEANNTAYIVMEFVDGITLRQYLKKNGRLRFADICTMITPLCSALGRIHRDGLIHRDISPDNIMILKDGSLKLMDFGSARYYDFGAERSLSVMLKPGYAPEEQYRTKGNQGPWTDIYAICATIYRSITGMTPEDSVERVYSDNLKLPSKLGVRITPNQEAVLLKGLAVYQQERYKSIDEFLGALTPVISEEYVPPREDGSRKKEIAKTPDPVCKPVGEDSVTMPLHEEPKSVRQPSEEPVPPKPAQEEPKAPESVAQEPSPDDALHMPLPKKKSKKGLIIAGIAVAAVALLGAAAFLVINAVSAGSYVRVPRFVAFTLEEAEKKAEENELKLSVSEKVHDSSVKMGYVISQSNPVNSDVKKGSTVYVTVSLGKSDIEVPDLAGKTVDEAKEALEKLGLVLKTEEEYSDDVDEGEIISQSVEAEEKADEGTEITITVSKGEAPEDDDEEDADDSSEE